MVTRVTDGATPEELADSAYTAVHRTTNAPDPGVRDVTDPGTPRPPETLLQPREQVVVDAQSGRLLDSYLAQDLVHAAHREEQAHYDRQRDPSVGAYLHHVLTGRDRA